MTSELSKRLAVAAVGIPLAILIIYVGGWIMAVVFGIIAAMGSAELYRLARARGVQAFALAGALLAALFVLLPELTIVPERRASQLMLAATLAFSAAAIFRRGVTGSPLAASAVTLFGAVYTGATLMYAVMLRELPIIGANPGWSAWVGPALIAFPITLTWMGDTWAYFGGHRFGRHKLIPSVSPGKTVEGAIASVVGTALTGALYALFVFDMWLGVPISPLAGALAGLIISPVAQIGDLVESLIKREAGAKDSGALLPGHGGVLDRFDALFFTIPVTYALVHWGLQYVS